MSADLDRILNRAKIGVMSKMDSVFITTVLFSLKFSWDKTIPTACTDGLTLKVNPEFFTNMGADARMGLLAHEAWHVAFQHMLRYGERDFRTWNIAADYVINLMLVDAGYTLPEGGLLDHQYADMSTEQVYDKLIQGAKDQPDFQMDMSAPGGGEGSPSTEEVEQQIMDVLVKAATQSRMQGDSPGTVPSDIEVFLDRLLNPKLPWETILQNYMTALAPEDYSYRKLNRRFLPDYYLPSLYGEALENIAIAVDTSGSVTDQQFAAFLSEIHTIQKRLSPEMLTVIDFDTRIQKVHEIPKDQSIAEVKFHGRGGTCVKELLEWATENKPTALLIFTDGEFRELAIDPKIPVVWVIHSKRASTFTYPFGKVIDYPM